MAKAKETIFFCKECGYESAKWAGQCPACHEWNRFVEAPAERPVKAAVRSSVSVQKNKGEQKQIPLAKVTELEEERIKTHMEEFDRVLGGGIVKGSLVLVGGDPGIGKSTLLTQICKMVSDDGHKVLYITGEESLSQIKTRADRIGTFSENLLVMAETDLDVIEETLSAEQPEIAVIDSIQTVYRPDVNGAPGSLGQVRECTALFMQLAKGLGISIFVVGHVTKEGVVAGPRTLEHMVDTVLYFEGESQGTYRILRGVKNRFGSTNEIGVFEMRADGLNEVKNPSEFMLVGRPENASGSIVSCSVEGTRPILVEIQALVARTALGNPRRSSTGIDYNRMNLLIAVLEKRLGFQLSECDAYVNIVGGVKINETALDLAILIAIASSYLDIVVDADTIALGEVGLSGEVRNVSMIEARVNEAKKLGFKKCIIPKSALQALHNIDGVNLVGVSDVKEAIRKVQKQ